MAIYDKNRNMLILADNELSINNLLTKEEVYQLGFDAGYEEGYEAGMEECYPDYSKKYFTIEMTSDGTVTVASGLDYRLNGGDWETVTGADLTVPSNNGDIFEFRCVTISTLNFLFSQGRKPTGTFIVYGNIMSLFYGDDYFGKTIMPHNILRLFTEDTGLTDASNLILPATTVGASCYEGMFAGCANLLNPPQLPATVLAEWCYGNMFAGCTSLTTAPELPATELAKKCYANMFSACTSLTEAPVLPATSCDASYESYSQMFIGCANLSKVTCLLYDGMLYFYNWMRNVSPTGTFIKHPNANWFRGDYGIPNGWTVIDAEL